MNTTKEELKKRVELSEELKRLAFSQEEAEKVLQRIYAEAPEVQKPFGETVEGIMKSLGLTKKWGKREILDVNTASELTGLNPEIFRKNMYKPSCVIDMALIVSICIGFKLSPILTQKVLLSAGMDFRLSNPEHLAYIFLLEHCNELDIDECNKILEYLGVPKTRQLGSRGRLNGETLEYKRKKKSKSTPI